MKKISAVLFSFLLVLGLAACGEVRESASPAAGSAENGMETANAETVSPEAAGTETSSTETEESGMQQSAGQQNTILIAYAPGEDGDMVKRAAGLLAQEPGGDLFPLEEETDLPSEIEAGADRTGETGTQAETNTPDGPYEFIFLGFSAGGILSGEMLLNFDGQINGTALIVGEALGTLYSYDFAYLDHDTGLPIFRDNKGSATSVINGEEVPNYTLYESEVGLVRSGYSTPPSTGGINMGLRYKNWHLNASFTYALGGVARLPSLYNGSTGNIFDPEFNMTTDILDHWRQPGDEAFTNIPALYDDYSYDNLPVKETGTPFRQARECG